MSVEGFEQLPGTELQAGSFTISDEENSELVRVLGGPGLEDGAAHPTWAYIATQRGIGVSVAGLCELAGFDVNDGPMLGSTELEYLAPLRTGVEYRVTGEIVGIERKQGRKAGVFDILTFRERLLEPDGGQAAVATNTFILPRRGLS
jgi:hypothetical protein